MIAIAAGIVDGLQAGNNAKSALLSRGLAEIARLGIAIGTSPDTFFGVAGVGDLATSCFSPEGRNRSCGEALGKGMGLDEYLAKSPYVVEGVATARSVMDLAKKYRVDMPIAQSVHAVLFEGVDPIEAIGKLMSREPKAGSQSDSPRRELLREYPCRTFDHRCPSSPACSLSRRRQARSWAGTPSGTAPSR